MKRWFQQRRAGHSNHGKRPSKAPQENGSLGHDKVKVEAKDGDDVTCRFATPCPITAANGNGTGDGEAKVKDAFNGTWDGEDGLTYGQGQGGQGQGQERVQWASAREFLLTCVGYSVGLGNVWRFPYLCYKSGGGAFLIPYVIMIILIGMPLLFLEYAFGQYFGIGSLSIFKKVCPLFQGIGVCFVNLNALVSIYYNVIIALSLFYLFSSFTSELPWSSCSHPWNTPLCDETRSGSGNTTNASLLTTSVPYTTTFAASSNVSLLYNLTRTSPSDEFFRHAVLAVQPYHSIENIGQVQWKICLCLLLAWMLVVIFISRGIRSSGKVAYFTATFPYVMLTVLVMRGVTLPGAMDGILYFIKPNWYILRKPEIWFAAATQLFYSNNLAWGGMITMASYNQFRHNCLRDSIVVNVVSFLTSLYAGFAVFSIIGYMAQEYNVSIDKVINSGPDLAFIVYPRALSLMPLAQLWSVLFFFMLFLLGIGSQMVLIVTVVTGLSDEFPMLSTNACVRLLTTCVVATLLFLAGLACTTQMIAVETLLSSIGARWPWLTLLHRFKVLVVVCTVLFLCGVPLVTQGGMFVLQLMDSYSATVSVMTIGVLECVVVAWIYNFSKFANNVREMIDYRPGWFFRATWTVITPLMILAILVFSFVMYKPAKYGDYSYPLWADTLGWGLALFSILPIPVMAIYKLFTAPGDSFSERLRYTLTPTLTEKPIRFAQQYFDNTWKQTINLGTTGDDDVDIDDDQRTNLPSPPLGAEKHMLTTADETAA